MNLNSKVAVETKTKPTFQGDRQFLLNESKSAKENVKFNSSLTHFFKLLILKTNIKIFMVYVIFLLFSFSTLFAIFYFLTHVEMVEMMRSPAGRMHRFLARTQLETL